MTGGEIGRGAAVSRVPKILRETPRWVCYKLVNNVQTGKKNKVPCDPATGAMITWQRSEHWMAYEQAKRRASESEYAAGYGFVTSKEDDILVVDLDDCWDERAGDFQFWAKRLATESGGYIERSPSGRGLHIWARGRLPKPGRKVPDLKMEMYQSERFMTVTEDVPDWAEPVPDDLPERVVWSEATYAAMERAAGMVAAWGASSRYVHYVDLFFGRVDEWWRIEHPNVAEIDESSIDQSFANRVMHYVGTAGVGDGEDGAAERRMGAAVDVCGLARFYREKWDSERRMEDGAEGTWLRRTVWTAYQSWERWREEHRPAGPQGERRGRRVDADALARAWVAAGAGETWRYWDGAWYRWDGRCWAGDDEGLNWEIRRFLRDYRAENEANIIITADYADKVIRCAADDMRYDFSAGSTTGGFVNFRNGVLDVSTGTLLDHEKEMGFRYVLPFDYDGAGEMPGIRAFLERTIPDAMGRESVLGHIGLALMGDTALHFAVLLLGPTRSGKSTVLKLANLVCGQLPDSNAGGALFEPGREGDNARAVHRLNRIVTIEEMPADALRGEESAKALIAHGGASMREMYGKSVRDNQWRPKILMGSNDAPGYGDRSRGLTNRLIIVDCPNSLLGGDEKIDPYLFGKLAPEVGALAAACISAGRAILATGAYPVSESMLARRAEIEREGNSAKIFCYEHIEKGEEEDFIISRELYSEYVNYCGVVGYKSLNAVNFGRTVCAFTGAVQGVRWHGGKAIRILKGVKRRPDAEGAGGVGEL